MFFLWFFGVGSVDGFRSAFRFAPRSVLPVSPFSPSFAPPFRFVCSFGRVVEVVRAAVFGAGRLACRLAWRCVGAFVVCAVFVSSCSWALSVVSGFPFSSFGVSSVLSVSAGRGAFPVLRALGAGCGCGVVSSRPSFRVVVQCCRLVCVFLIGVSVSAFRLSCRRWRLVPPPRVGVSCRRIDVGVLFVRRLVSVLSCCAVFVSSFSRAVSSASRRCRHSVRVRPVGRVVWRRVWRRVVGAWRHGGAWLLDVGGAMFVATWRVVDRAVGGSVMPCRVAECAVSGTRNGTHGGTGSERVMRRFCQLVLAVCRTVAASWMDAGGRCAVGVVVVSSACLFFFLASRIG